MSDMTDDLYRDAVALVTMAQHPSPSYVSRKLNIRWSAAEALVKRMQADGICSPPDNRNQRTMLVPPPTAWVEQLPDHD